MLFFLFATTWIDQVTTWFNSVINIILQYWSVITGVFDDFIFVSFG